MTVLDFLGEDEFGNLQDRASESPYWESCLTFIEQKAQTNVNNLSEKQRDWLDKIVDGLQ